MYISEYNDNIKEIRMDNKEKRYAQVNFADIVPVPCPCGMSKRAFIEESNGDVSFHVVEISKEARKHYHKEHQEVYFILKGTGFLEVDDEKIPVKEGSSVLIKKYCRHRALGDLLIANVSLPAFDAEDEYFD